MSFYKVIGMPLPDSAQPQITSEHLQTLRDELETRVAQIRQVNQDLMQHRRARYGQEKEIIDLTDQLEQLQIENNTLYAENDALYSQFDQLNQVIAWLQDELTRLFTFIHYQHAHVVHRGQIIAGIYGQQHQMQAQFAHVHQQFIDNQTQLATTIDDLRTQLTAGQQDYTKISQELDRINQLVEQQSEYFSTTMSGQHDRIESLMLENAELRKSRSSVDLQLQQPVFAAASLAENDELKISLSDIEKCFPSDLNGAWDIRRVQEYLLSDPKPKFNTKNATTIAASLAQTYCEVHPSNATHPPDLYIADARLIPPIKNETFWATKENRFQPNWQPPRSGDTSIFHILLMHDREFKYLEPFGRVFRNMLQVADSNGQTVWESLLLGCARATTKRDLVYEWIQNYLITCSSADFIYVIRSFLIHDPAVHLRFGTIDMTEPARNETDPKKIRMMMDQQATLIFDSIMRFPAKSHLICERLRLHPGLISQILDGIDENRFNEYRFLVLIGRVLKSIESNEFPKIEAASDKAFVEVVSKYGVLALERFNSFSDIRGVLTRHYLSAKSDAIGGDKSRNKMTFNQWIQKYIDSRGQSDTTALNIRALDRQRRDEHRTKSGDIERLTHAGDKKILFRPPARSVSADERDRRSPDSYLWPSVRERSPIRQRPTFAPPRYGERGRVRYLDPEDYDHDFPPLSGREDRYREDRHRSVHWDQDPPKTRYF